MLADAIIVSFAYKGIVAGAINAAHFPTNPLINQAAVAALLQNLSAQSAIAATGSQSARNSGKTMPTTDSAMVVLCEPR